MNKTSPRSQRLFNENHSSGNRIPPNKLLVQEATGVLKTVEAIVTAVRCPGNEMTPFCWRQSMARPSDTEKRNCISFLHNG